jgi:hypothetical protein
MRKLALPALTIAVAAGLALSACAGPAAVPRSVATKPVASPSPAPSGRSDTAPAKQIDVCAAVPLARVVSIVGKPYVATKDDPVQLVSGVSVGGCVYEGDTDSLLGAAIKVYYGNPAAVWSLITAEDASLDNPMTLPVSGLGDKAMTDGIDDIAAQYGNNIIEVEDLSEPPDGSYVTPAEMKQLVLLVHAAMS